MHETPLLLLDEPTADLDPATEREFLRSLFALMDEILVLERERIVERGWHSDLRARRGLYRRLWNLQNRAFLAADLW